MVFFYTIKAGIPLAAGRVLIHCPVSSKFDLETNCGLLFVSVSILVCIFYIRTTDTH